MQRTQIVSRAPRASHVQTFILRMACLSFLISSSRTCSINGVSSGACVATNICMAATGSSAASIARSNLLNCLGERRSEIVTIVACRIVSPNCSMICSWAYWGSIPISSCSTSWSNRSDMVTSHVFWQSDHENNKLCRCALINPASVRRPGLIDFVQGHTVTPVRGTSDGFRSGRARQTAATAQMYKINEAHNIGKAAITRRKGIAGGETFLDVLRQALQHRRLEDDRRNRHDPYPIARQ